MKIENEKESVDSYFSVMLILYILYGLFLFFLFILICLCMYVNLEKNFVIKISGQILGTLSADIFPDSNFRQINFRGWQVQKL